jgi:hypothetical protein
MTDDDLLKALGRRLDEHEPSEALRRRAADSAREAADRARARTRRRRRIVIAVAGALVIAGASAAALTTRPWEGGSLPVGPGARAGISESAVLARAPWLVQGSGSPYVQDARELPSLEFPAGTGYAAAARALVGSVLADGTLPERAALRPALERGIVWDARARRLSLTSPFSYTGLGRIRAPTFRIPPSLSPAEASRIVAAARGGAPAGRALAGAITLDVPTLRPCQIQGGPGAPCRLPKRTG